MASGTGPGPLGARALGHRQRSQDAAGKENLELCGRHTLLERNSGSCAGRGELPERKMPTCAAQWRSEVEKNLSVSLGNRAQLGLFLSAPGPGRAQLEVFLSGVGYHPAQVGPFLSGVGRWSAQLPDFLSRWTASSRESAIPFPARVPPCAAPPSQVGSSLPGRAARSLRQREPCLCDPPRQQPRRRQHTASLAAREPAARTTRSGGGLSCRRRTPPYRRHAHGPHAEVAGQQGRIGSDKGRDEALVGSVPSLRHPLARPSDARAPLTRARRRSLCRSATLRREGAPLATPCR